MLATSSAHGQVLGILRDPGETARMARRSTLALIVLVAGACAGCGEAGATDQAVEAREGNRATIGGIAYRVILFRELNVNIPPDRALVDGPPPPEGSVYLAAFLSACNTSEERLEPTDGLRLENAFGADYRRLEANRDNPFAYRPHPLEPGMCLPREDSAADRTIAGGALVFQVPAGDLGERPFVLVVEGEANGAEVERPFEVDL